MKEKTITSIALVFAFAVLGWVLYGAFSIQAAPTTGLAVYQQPQTAIPSECGDITDNSNVQHLSHHPDRFGECIKLVDPAKFREATGTDKSAYMSQNGIQ